MSPTTQGAMASGADAVEILARLWCRAEGNGPDDTISDAGHTVLDALLSGQDRKALAAIRQAETDLRAALAAPAPVVPEEVRRKLIELCDSVLGNAYLGKEEEAALADDMKRTLLAATPSKPVGDGPEASAPPAGGGAVSEREAARGKLIEAYEQLKELDADGDLPVRARDKNPPDSLRAVAERAVRMLEEIRAEDAAQGRPWWAHTLANFALDDLVYALAAAPEPAAGGEREIVRPSLDEAYRLFIMTYRVAGEADMAAQKARGERGRFFDANAAQRVALQAVIDLFLSAPSEAETAGGDGWRNDPSADERWNAGLDYGQTQLCVVLGVDPQSVSWDAATETLDGDVRSVIGNILTAWAGDNWRDVPTPANAGAEGGQA